MCTLVSASWALALCAWNAHSSWECWNASRIAPPLLYKNSRTFPTLCLMFVRKQLFDAQLKQDIEQARCQRINIFLANRFGRFSSLLSLDFLVDIWKVDWIYIFVNVFKYERPGRPTAPPLPIQLHTRLTPV